MFVVGIEFVNCFIFIKLIKFLIFIVILCKIKWEVMYEWNNKNFDVDYYNY